MADTPYDLLEDSLGTLTDAKKYKKEMNNILKEGAKQSGLSRKTIAHCKDMKFYYGQGWLDNDPFEKDPTVKFNDKISGPFIAVLSIIKDLKSCGMLELLTPIVDGLAKKGITLDISEVISDEAEDEQYISDVIENACDFQKKITTLSDKIKEVDAPEAENIGFIQKNSYGKVLAFYNKKKGAQDDEKIEKVEEEYQQVNADSLQLMKAYQNIYEDTLD